MTQDGDFEMELSIVMPCLNEEKALGMCIDEAKTYIQEKQITGEIIVVDNGSTDNSIQEAVSHGARVIEEPKRGYGMALRRGIHEASGKVIIMGDCDTTYDFKNLDGFYRPLAKGNIDLVIGNRFSSKTEKGAMCFINRMGAEVLSVLGRMRYGVRVRDFHCGLRGITREAAQNLDFKTEGMEFATEMIGLAAESGMKIGETLTGLRRCRGDRISKLEPISDGFRHLRFILGFMSRSMEKTGYGSYMSMQRCSF